MSVCSMTRRAIRLPVIFATGTKSATASGDDKTPEDNSPLNRIVAFIPSEVIAIYIAGFSILKPSTDLVKWVVFAVTAALVPLFIFASAAIVSRSDGYKVRLEFWKGIVLTLMAWVAYVAWTAAIPESPFLSLHSEANRIAAFTAVVLSFVLPMFAKWIALE